MVTADPDGGEGPGREWFEAELRGARTEITGLRSMLADLVAGQADPCEIVRQRCVAHRWDLPCAVARARAHLGWPTGRVPPP